METLEAFRQIFHDQTDLGRLYGPLIEVDLRCIVKLLSRMYKHNIMFSMCRVLLENR